MNSRRRFLIGSTAAASPLISGPYLKAAQQSAEVIVIGAGAAGLAAARKLQDQGTDVVLLEGRSRIGGRVHTSNQWQGAPIDLGASWIHGIRRNPITRLAKQAGAKWVESDYDNFGVYRENGGLLNAKEENQLELLFGRIDRIVRSGQNSQRPLADLLKKDLAGYDTPLGQFAVNGLVEQEYAADDSAISGLGAYFGEEYGGSDVWFPKGYRQVIAPLAQGLKLHLGHVVQEVFHDQAGVSVVTSNGEFRAKRALITLPLGVLKRGKIRFSPALPQRKTQAIASLGMGLLNKVVLRFAKPFWSRDQEFFGRLSGEKGAWAFWLNLYHHIDEPILMGFNAAKFGRATESWSDQQIVASAQQALQGMFGNTNAVTGYQVTRWNADPFSGGSYSFLPPGASSRTIRALGEPISDRLFFAGEATSEDYPSTVHGAYLSGIREAERILG